MINFSNIATYDCLFVEIEYINTNVNAYLNKVIHQNSLYVLIL